MSQLPLGWSKATIGEVCDLVNGKAFKPSDWSESGLPIVRIQNLNRPNAKFNHFDGEIEDRFLVECGDLLFAWSGTPGTSFGAHVWNGPKAVLNQHIFNVRFDKKTLDRTFFSHAINQTLDEQIAKAHGGVGLRHVTKGKFEETEISIPPLIEQQRIVEKIDSLTDKSRRARDHLDHIPRLAEKYKQAVLDLAFSHVAERARLLEMVESERGIPYGIVQTGTPYEGGVPTVRCGDIKDFHVGLNQLKRVDPKIERGYQRTRLKGGEVLIAIRGSVGETCVVPVQLAGCNISREVAMIPTKSDVSPQFVMYFLASSEAKRFILGNTKGVAQQGINLRDLKKLPTPDCSFCEQLAVVTRIETAFTWIDRLAANTASARRLLDHLDQLVLAKAFKGELVSQDPSDEPASILLERIRAERITAARANRGRKKAA